MKKLAIALLALGATVAAGAKTADELRIYINPGHGSWTGNDRPRTLITHPAEYSATNTDTTGFFESNTNLLKGFGLLEKLIEMGFPFDRTKNQTGERWQIGAARDLSQNLVMSRVKNGPYEASNTTSSPNYMLYNRSLLEIATEVEHNEFDEFISIHSNAATEGGTTNYHLYMYRGHNGKENVLAPGSWEMIEAGAKYSFPNPHAAWSATYTYINGDIDFMSSDKSGTYNELGYYGYLGVLKHGCPGYLVEGYFHTYQPARHRAMNWDVDIIEGYQYARGVAEYFQLPQRDATGEIYGIVRDRHERFSDKNYKANPSTDDLYKPLNGAKVTLSQGGNVVAEYTTDGFYNGAFVFKGLQPGTYTVEIKHDEYKALEPFEVTVKAGNTTYPTAFMESLTYEGANNQMVNYPDPAAQMGGVIPADSYDMSTVYTDVEIPELAGKLIRRVITRNGKMYILALDKEIEYAAAIPEAIQAEATIIVYDPSARKVLANVSTDGAAGSIAAISDIQLTADGYLLACNATKNQYDDSQIQSGDAGRGTFYVYKWDNDEAGVPTGKPAAWLSTKSSGLWYRAYPSRFTYSGTSADGMLVVTMPTITAPNYQMRAMFTTVLDGEMQAENDYKPLVEPFMMGQLGSDWNIFTSPVADDMGLIVAKNLGVRSWSMKTPLDPMYKGNDALADVDGRAGMFKYAGGSFIVMPVVEGNSVSGLKLVNITGEVNKAKVVEIKLDTPLAVANAASVAAAGEVEATLDPATDEPTAAWINLYLLRDGKLSKVTTKGVQQPQGKREMAYGLEAVPAEDHYDITFNLTGDAEAVSLVMTAEGTEPVEIDLGAQSAGQVNATIDFTQFQPGFDYNWAVNVQSATIAQAGLVMSDPSGLTVRGGVIPITDPEQASFGYVAVGHGNNKGIDIYDPAGNKVATRLFVSHKMFGGENGSNGNSNQSNPFRGNERNGYAVFGTWGDAAYGAVAVNPLDATEEPFTLFAGDKSGTGCFVYNNTNLGGGTAGISFIDDAQGDTWLLSFSEDHENMNGKGATENSLIKQHLSGPWLITEAPEVIGYKNTLANTNVDLYTYGTGVWAVQIREAGNNTSSVPTFCYISDVLTDPTLAFTSADESIVETVPYNSASIALTKDGSILALGARNAIAIYDVTWNGNTPALAYKYSFPVETHIWSHLRFDAAGNLHAYLREGGYRVYSLPAISPVAVTPAPKANTLSNLTSVDDLVIEAADATAVYYNLQGVQVSADNLTPGIYVKVAGTTATKVLVK